MFNSTVFNSKVIGRRTYRGGATLAAMALLLAAGGCGKKDDNNEESRPSASIGATPSATASATATPSGEPTASAAASASPSSSAGAEEVAKTVTLDLVKGKPKEIPELTVKMKEGEVFRIEVTTDKPYEIHVHGYDQKLEAVPGETRTLDITCNKTGSFAVEVEDTGFQLFTLQVN